MNQHEIAQILREIGILIELTDKEPMKGFAYRRAARSIEAASHFEELVQKGKLEELPGVGKKIASIIHTLKNGKLAYYQKLKKKIPSGLYDLLNIPGISVSRVRILFQDYKIKTLNQLEKLINKEIKIKGFSPSFLKKMRKRVLKMKREGTSLLWNQAMELASVFQNSFPSLIITGSLRRKLEVISSLDFVSCEKIPIEKFVQHLYVKKRIKQTKNRIKVLLKKGIFTSLTFASEKTFPLLLLKTTGSSAHLKALKKEGPLLSLPSEEEIYAHLHLPWIPPELREDGSEVQLAKQGKLPKLIEYEDLQGTFHCHTSDSDGHHTLHQMVDAAKKLGWKYLGISDHSKSLRIANGLTEERLFNQIKKIRLENKKDPFFYIFSGVECDILKDGSLDYENSILKELDFVIASVHSLFKMKKKEMTQRIVKAIEHPYTTMIGHLTGRLLRYRDPYLVDIPYIIDACIANHKIMELNAYPNRMDLDWRYWKKAKEKGLKCSINPDAHSTKELLNCKYGVFAARKGWLEKEDVINTFSLKELKMIGIPR